ncbi:RING finger domain protein [Aspergillus sclerotioniger CBS 115572]|uniref:RING-type E3 ubiquitin transferase n=1 Tax=Aspergillus sclerotioniger CBS 115572 TaxID=1450535 RepID=A0A317WND5_9EURO|nr:RING finger domain protein [Aspergillus sclerotioniger CBS 115572]PWY87979.1 RING finger domain protein [Aspergillus sclerotioniger CBS 115572]
MSHDVDLQQEILQRTLQEVAHEEGDNEANPCVICLEPVSEAAVAVPCRHANFDFLCLVSWLELRRNCPLCKSEVTSVRYDLENPNGHKVYQLPVASATASSSSHPPEASFHRAPRRPRRPRPQQPPHPAQTSDDPLRRRQHIYRHQLYSLRVGSNRLSQYRELTPERFNREEELVSRARKWIRRELKVFEFLNPETEEPASGRVARAGPQRLENRRGNNAEFLLEYIIAILRTVDIKGSAGQAEELLRDFIGRGNARLFLHELQAWLRSPYSSLEDWDRNVQYEDVGATGEPDRTSTPVYRGRGRVSKPYTRRGQHQRSSRDALAQARRVQYARDRYIPD